MTRTGSRLLPAIALALLALLFLWFLLPVFSGVLNIANAAGMLACAAVMLLLVRWDACKRLIAKLWKKRGARVLLIVLAIFLAALVGLTAVLIGCVLSGMRQPETEAKTVIVLGCQVRGEHPSLLLDHRIETAADYLAAHPEAKCIVSGGQGSGEAITEAECMRRGLLARGIAADRIYLEDASERTIENLENSMRVMAREGLDRPVVIVSNNFHLYRALQMASSLGMEATGLPAACEWYMLPTYLLREVMALIKFRLG